MSNVWDSGHVQVTSKFIGILVRERIADARACSTPSLLPVAASPAPPFLAPVTGAIRGPPPSYPYAEERALRPPTVRTERTKRADKEIRRGGKGAAASAPRETGSIAMDYVGM